MFTLKIGTVMEGSNLKYPAWAIGIYLFTTYIKGVSSMRLSRELGISQKAAWFMLHRLRLALEAETGPFAGPVELDETHIGGKRKNKPLSKRKELRGRGPVDMTPVGWHPVPGPRHRREGGEVATCRERRRRSRRSAR